MTYEELQGLDPEEVEMIEDRRMTRQYGDWPYPGVYSYEDALEARYRPVLPQLHSRAVANGYLICPDHPICCPRCWEENVADAIDYEAWARAFPEKLAS